MLFKSDINTNQQMCTAVTVFSANCNPVNVKKSTNKTRVHRHAYHSTSLLTKSVIPQNTLQYNINL